MLCSRRDFLRLTGAAAVSASLPSLTLAETAGPVVHTRLGSLRGLVHDGVHVFRGVPCALPPYAPERRLREAVFVPAWKGELAAVTPGDIPLQAGPKETPVLGGGDCLRLNIWTPEPGATKCPVMVYFPGGGSVSCNNNDPRFDGQAFARDGVVLVTANYRVNVDGFLQLPDVPANLGIRDMIAALKWVHEHIAGFGGDPDRVTVFGQSAGATHVTSLLAAPAASGLFRRAILQSPAALAQNPKELSAKVTAQLCAFYGISATREAMAALPFEQLIRFRAFTASKARDEAWAMLNHGNVSCFKPYIDGEVLPCRPVDAIRAGSAKGVEIMAGSTEEEWRHYTVPHNGLARIEQADIDRLLRSAGLPADLAETYRRNGRGQSLGDLFTALQSDFIFRMPANAVLEAQAQAKGRVWAYSFGWRSPAEGGQLGAAHSCDLPFVFQTLHTPAAIRQLGDHPPQALADAMHGAWVRFAAEGNPGWPAFDTQARTTMRFAESCAVVNDPWKKERQAMLLG